MSPQRIRVFEFEEPADNTEPLQIQIGSTVITGASTVDGLATLEFADALAGPGAQRAVGVVKFLRTCIPDADEWEKFRAAVKERQLDLGQLVEVCTGFVEEYTERPTEPPASSSNGRRKTGSRSAATSSSAA